MTSVHWNNKIHGEFNDYKLLEASFSALCSDKNKPFISMHIGQHIRRYQHICDWLTNVSVGANNHTIKSRPIKDHIYQISTFTFKVLKWPEAVMHVPLVWIIITALAWWPVRPSCHQPSTFWHFSSRDPLYLPISCWSVCLNWQIARGTSSTPAHLISSSSAKSCF